MRFFVSKEPVFPKIYPQLPKIISFDFWKSPKISDDLRRLPKISQQLLKIAKDFPMTSEDNPRCTSEQGQRLPKDFQPIASIIKWFRGCSFRRKKLSLLNRFLVNITLAIVSWAWEIGLNAWDHNFRSAGGFFSLFLKEILRLLDTRTILKLYVHPRAENNGSVVASQDDRPNQF